MTGMTRGTTVTTRGRGVTRGPEVGADKGIEKKEDTGGEKGGAGSKDAPGRSPATQEG